MKILYLQDDFPPRSAGGAGVIALNLALEMKRRGEQVSVLTTVENKEEVGEEDQWGIKIFKIHSCYHERWRAYLSVYNPQTVRKINEIIKQIKPDVVHAHNIHYHLSYHSLKLAKASGAKVFLTAHDAMLFNYGKTRDEKKITVWELFKKNKKRYNPFRNFLIKKYLAYVDHVIAVSEALCSALRNNGILNVSVIRNGIDCREWEKEPKAAKAFAEKHNLIGKKVILFGGRLSGQKGGEVAVKMLSLVIKEIPEAVLLVLGRGNDYAERMKELASELGIGKSLCFAGWVSGETLRSAYHASDVVVVLSKYLDPFPTIVLEAMASKKPVIVTSLGGAREAVVHGETGWIVDPDSPSEASQKVVELLSNPSEALLFGERGFERVRREFSLDRQGSSLISYYRGSNFEYESA